jgi:uncharacterized membrane protein
MMKKIIMRLAVSVAVSAGTHGVAADADAMAEHRATVACEIAAPLLSPACISGHAPSNCGEPMWV